MPGPRPWRRGWCCHRLAGAHRPASQCRLGPTSNRKDAGPGGALKESDRTVNPNLPPREALPPNPRHRLRAVKEGTFATETNSVIEPSVDVAADVAAINRGEATRMGETYIVNERTYRLKSNGRLFPVSGPGIHQLGRGAFKALGVYNRYGVSPRPEEILDLQEIEPAEREAARAAWRAGQR